jgi:hypothetical protein
MAELTTYVTLGFAKGKQIKAQLFQFSGITMQRPNRENRNKNRQTFQSMDFLKQKVAGSFSFTTYMTFLIINICVG